MARLLDRASQQSLASSSVANTSQTQTINTTHGTSSLLLNMDSGSVPHVHFSTMIPEGDNPMAQTSSTLPITLPTSSASDTQQYIMLSAPEGGTTAAGGQITVTRAPDLTQVLAGLQNSGELSTLLQQQPNLLQELSAIAAGELSSNPESLRFQYEAEHSHENPITSGVPKSSKPVVYREQDRFLPIHNVSRTMRNSVPKSGKVSKEAKECVQECVSEFVSFITSEASDKCIQEKRKTITGDDILFAMATLGFDNHIEPLRVYLQKYREYIKADKVASPPSTIVASAQGVPIQTSTGNTMNMTGLRPVMATIPASLSTTQQQVVVTNPIT